jgi:hypothetical protein
VFWALVCVAIAIEEFKRVYASSRQKGLALGATRLAV